MNSRKRPESACSRKSCIAEEPGSSPTQAIIAHESMILISDPGVVMSVFVGPLFD